MSKIDEKALEAAADVLGKSLRECEAFHPMVEHAKEVIEAYESAKAEQKFAFAREVLQNLEASLPIDAYLTEQPDRESDIVLHNKIAELLGDLHGRKDNEEPYDSCFDCATMIMRICQQHYRHAQPVRESGHEEIKIALQKAGDALEYWIWLSSTSELAKFFDAKALWGDPLEALLRSKVALKYLGTLNYNAKACETNSQWQPIETAPANKRFLGLAWEGDWNNPKSRRVIVFAYKTGNGATDYQNHRIEEGGAFEITHWQPEPTTEVEGQS